MGIGAGRPAADIAAAVSKVLRTLAICAPVALGGACGVPARAGESTTLAVDIPAQSLAHALEAFASQTGLQLVYVSEIVKDHKSHAVSAGLGANEALARILEATGLSFKYLTPHSIRIVAAMVGPTTEPARKPLSEDALHEVIVTANRREENLQNVPMTIQVLTGEALERLNAPTFDDFVKYLPAVTAHGVGPGQNNIYVRGLGTADSGEQGSGWGGIFPNVAVYLDEQSAQLPGRNLDIYAADIERIELLEGPQGTLFGAGAEAGVLRYITNKPKLDRTEVKVDAGYATTAHGAQSSNVDATLNIPLIADTLAVRGVIYNERRGGYINNLPAKFARSDADLSVQKYFGGKVPANSVAIDNFDLAANHINPVTYAGLRVEALYHFDDDWNVLLAQSYQNMEADGVFTEMAANSLGQPLPDLSVQLYNPSYDKDRFENTALTIDGRAGALKLVYAGAYLVRNVEQVQDYTSYARGPYAVYYQCGGRSLATVQCFTPSATWRERERNTHLSHELRVSTPADWRIRGVGGLFYENYRIQDQLDYFFLSALPFFHPIGPPTGYYTSEGVFVSEPATSNNPNVREPQDAFFNDITRGYTQKAAYASVDFDVVPQKLTLTTGTRYFRTDTSEVGSEVGARGCELILNSGVPNPCVNRSNFTNLNSEGLDRIDSGFRSRANLDFKVTDDALLYYTWSQGYRAGGFNRASFAPEPNSPMHEGAGSWQSQTNANWGWTAPLSFGPDTLINNEIGWKTMWMDRRVQWNGAIYQEDWNNAQIVIGAHGDISYGIILNGGNYRVRGIETSCIARVAAGLTIEAGTAWNHSELVKQATFPSANGTPQTSAKGVSYPSGALGSALAGAPPMQGDIRARYEFAFNDYTVFTQLDAVHQSHSLSTTEQLSFDLQGNSTAYDLPAFTTYDGALGLGKDSWLVQIYGQNLTDTRAELYANYWQWYKGVTVSRPRTVGLRFSYKVGDR
jgi:iron complex outermembrane recepter protein